MPTPISDTYLGRQFAAYGDGWPAADHADAMACRDLEQAIAYGLVLYRFVTDQAERIAARLARTGAAYDLPAAREVESLLILWLEPAAAAEARVATMEAKGFAVDRSAEFREAVLEARVATSIPVDRAAEQSERLARDGFRDTKSSAELRRELQHRLGG